MALELGAPLDPVAAVRQLCRALVAKAIESSWTGPPWDVELLASLQGIRVEHVAHLGDQRDALWASDRVLVSLVHAPTRRRFSVAHEIVHGALAPYDESVDLKTLPAWSRGAAERELEFLCQVGAAELVMPMTSFVHQMGGDAPSLSAVLRLAREFEVSAEAAGRRVVDLAAEHCAVLCARPDDGLEKPPPRSLRKDAQPRQAAKPADLVVTTYHASPAFGPVRIAVGEPMPRCFEAYLGWSFAKLHPTRNHLRINTALWPAYPELGHISMEVVPLPLRKKPIEILALLRRAAMP